MSSDHIQWIAIDWGTSNLRGWAMSDSGRILDQANSEQGMATVNATDEDFESALLDLIQPWLKAGGSIPVIACGMVGARQGWLEVPYDEAPCSPHTSLTKVPTRDPRIDVSIFAGVCQESPADVMRGEETQIAGLLSRSPDFGGLICLPGTHTKWCFRRREENISTK
ncbi:MAG: 2-dehydro-3-deoxygalactonokinase [Alphaproteobacteria bacterium]|nr:2-dehydro-3-deoxygalactonokinase [Alphaproteobacteria bacterium]